MTAPVAFVADTHDNEELILDQVSVMVDRGVEEMVHLGDVLTPACLVLYDPIDTVHWITGNGDQPMKEELSETVREMGGHAHKWNEKLTFGEKTFLCRHGMEHDLSYPMVATQASIDYVMHGHWHNQERTVVGKPSDDVPVADRHGGEVLNPGDDGMYLYHPVQDEFEHIAFD